MSAALQLGQCFAPPISLSRAPTGFFAHWRARRFLQPRPARCSRWRAARRPVGRSPSAARSNIPRSAPRTRRRTLIAPASLISPGCSGVGVAKRERAHLILGVLAEVDRARNQLLQAAADHGGAVAVHQHHRMLRRARAPATGPPPALTTSRLVSPNSSCWSQNGACSPIAAPRWKTGTIGLPAMQNGITAGA